jgi:broad specificity phosphatase PhoE
MIIYFVRHGTTEDNDNNNFQLPTANLSKKGVEEAEFLAKRFETIAVEAIFSSVMTRAFQTAEIIGKHIKHPVTGSELFEEVKRPSVVRGRSKFDPEVRAIMKEVKERFADQSWRHSDEENYFLLKDRAKKALDFLLARNEERILLVTHGEILKMMLSIIIYGESLTPEMFHPIQSTFGTFNTGITKIQYNELGWYILAWNDHAHLGEVR